MIQREKKKMSEEAALLRLASLCAKAEYCTYDIRRKLTSWELPDGASDRILKRLTDEKYVDDSRYAHAFVRSKCRFDKWGRIKISNVLRMKGLDENIIEEALTEIDPTASDDTLRQLLAAKVSKISFKNDYDRKAKLIRFALSRGFTMDAISRCLSDINIEQTEN